VADEPAEGELVPRGQSAVRRVQRLLPTRGLSLQHLDGFGEGGRENIRLAHPQAIVDMVSSKAIVPESSPSQGCTEIESEVVAVGSGENREEQDNMVAMKARATMSSIP
jgi:hypothetical protein